MPHDGSYLLDILLAARDALAFVDGVTWSQFSQSRLHQHAVIKALEIIGEAASRISVKTRKEHPEVPWVEIIGMRHRLVHGYFEVDVEKVWETIRHDLIPLIEVIERLIPPEKS